MVAVRQRLASMRGLTADYDRAADVLYIALGEPQPAEGEDGPRGIVYRYAMSDNAPCGVTVVGYQSHQWPEAMAKLATLVGSHLAVDPQSVVEAIEAAVMDA